MTPDVHLAVFVDLTRYGSLRTVRAALGEHGLPAHRCTLRPSADHSRGAAFPHGRRSPR